MLAVISLLASLAGPGVMQAREAARNGQCKTHLKELALAAHGHHEQHGRFPIGIENQQNPPSSISPHALLLPFLEETEVYERVTLQDTFARHAVSRPASQSNHDLMFTSVTGFECPSDSVPAGGVSYRMCAGTSPGNHQSTGVAPPDAALCGVASQTGQHLTGITDGTSQTVFFSERLVGDNDPSHYSPRRDVVTRISGSAPFPFLTATDAAVACNLNWSQVQYHSSFSGSSWLDYGYQSTLYNHVHVPNSRLPDCSQGQVDTDLGAFSARSNHGDTVNAAMCDGRVQAVSSSIDLAVWRAIGTIAGNEDTGEF